MREASIWTVAIVFIGLALLVPMVNVGYESTAQTATTVNESVTVNYTSPSAVDPPDYALSLEPNATVYNSTGSELTNGTDYTWHPNNGTVVWANTSATTSGETAAVTYDYRAPPRDARNARQVLHAMEPVLGLLVLVVGAAAAFKYGTGGF